MIKLDFNALEDYRPVSLYPGVPKWFEFQNFYVVLSLRIFFVVLLLAMLIIALVYPLSSPALQNIFSTFIGLCIIFVPVFYIAIGWILLTDKSEATSLQRVQAERAQQFIQDNRIGFVSDYARSGHQGVVFDKKANSSSGPSKEHVFHPKNVLFIQQNGVQAELGTVLTTYRSRWFRQRQTYGYICLELSRPSPHIIVNAKANNSVLLDNLPVRLKAYEKLSLEGNFDEYFTTYTPDASKREALYVLTPDLMTVLIDNSRQFDIEVIDNKLYVYSNGGFDISDASLLEQLVGIINSVGQKALSRTKNYRLPHDPSPSLPVKRIRRQNLLWLSEALGYATVILLMGLTVYSLISTGV